VCYLAILCVKISYGAFSGIGPHYPLLRLKWIQETERRRGHLRGGLQQGGGSINGDTDLSTGGGRGPSIGGSIHRRGLSMGRGPSIGGSINGEGSIHRRVYQWGGVYP
jgi:hypothetical protein